MLTNSALKTNSAALSTIIYTDVNPDVTMTCSNIGCDHHFNLDLNNDGVIDFKLKVWKHTFPNSCVARPYSSGVDITLLHSNTIVVTDTASGYVAKLYANTSIADTSLYSIYLQGDETIARYDWRPSQTAILALLGRQEIGILQQQTGIWV